MAKWVCNVCGYFTLKIISKQEQKSLFFCRKGGMFVID